MDQNKLTFILFSVAFALMMPGLFFPESASGPFFVACRWIGALGALVGASTSFVGMRRDRRPPRSR